MAVAGWSSSIRDWCSSLKRSRDSISRTTVRASMVWRQLLLLAELRRPWALTGPRDLAPFRRDAAICFSERFTIEMYYRLLPLSCAN